MIISAYDGSQTVPPGLPFAGGIVPRKDFDPVTRKWVMVEDWWEDRVSADLATMSPELAASWVRFWGHCAAAGGSVPSKNWLKQARNLSDVLGSVYSPQLIRWIGFIRTCSQRYMQPSWGIFPQAQAIMCGLVWSGSLGDESVLDAVTELTLYCLCKAWPEGGRRPEHRSRKVANAGLWVLGQAGEAGVARLTRLHRQMPQWDTLATICHDVLKKMDASITMDCDSRLELSVPEFDFDEAGLWITNFGGQATVSISLSRPYDQEWSFHGVDRNEQEIKKRYPAEYETWYGLRQGLLEAKMHVVLHFRHCCRQQRSWTGLAWRQHFCDPLLVRYLARQLIWFIEQDGESRAVLWRQDAWRDIDGQAVKVGDASMVRLWHPVLAGESAGKAWSKLLKNEGITQPFDQVDRPIYKISREEASQAAYERYAGYMLDNSRINGVCSRMRWELLTQQQGANAIVDMQYRWPAAGINVQVFFNGSRLGKTIFLRDGQPLVLGEVPPLVLSETLYALNQFLDEGLYGSNRTISPIFDQAWEPCILEVLDIPLWENANWRREILTGILPGLAVGEFCHVEGAWLVVRREGREFVIHPGTANILERVDGVPVWFVARGLPDQYMLKAYEALSGVDRGVFMCTVLGKVMMLADGLEVSDRERTLIPTS